MRTAKLFIRGSREPIEITEEQGNTAMKMKKREGSYSEIIDGDTVSIGDSWTGELGDLRYVKFENVAEPFEEKIYSSKELFDFEEEIKPYCVSEGDDEYKKMINMFTKDVMDLDSRLFWSKETKSQLLEIRKKLDTFPVLSEWKIDNKVDKTKSQSEEEYEKRIKDVYEKTHKIMLAKELKENKVQVREDVEKVVKLRIVGQLYQSGELKYLEDNHAIRVEGNDFIILRHNDGSVPYNDLNHKLNRYKEWKGQKEYASGKEMEGYEEMTEHLVDNKTLNYEEQGSEESF